MAQMAQDKNLKKILLDIAREEKAHVGEFQALLLEKDQEQEKRPAQLDKRRCGQQCYGQWDQFG